MTDVGTARLGWQSKGLLDGRDPLSRWPPPASGSGELATVIDVLAEAPDTVTLRLRCSATHSFLPGQHFVVRVSTGGPFPALESYSVASSPWPDPSIIDLTIKEVPGGRVSPRLVRQIPVGAVLAIEGPFGYFTWTEADGGPLALVGAGSGMVPLMAIVRYAAAKQLNVPVRLLCSSAGRDHAIYHEHLAALAASHPWLEVTHTFTRDADDTYARYHRRIDATMLAETFACIAATCQAYVCGPPGTVRAAEAGLAAVGVAAGRLNTEEWD